MAVLLGLSIVALLYIYAGYPLLLRLIVWLRGPKPIARADITPSVSLLISAYNEAAVMRQKLANALAIDYPAGRLEVVVVSDASDDGTDEIVREFADRGVRLLRQPARRGKTAGLNAAVPQLAGEIVVFSDANAMYQPDAIRKLVRNFADPAVGCVTGEARYVESVSRRAADLGERAYWDYEIHQKRLETAIGSMVGGDGAIYAIRRVLWKTLPETAINDFLNPLQIVAAGWRGIFEPEAVCFEETAGGIGTEYGRRVRIVSRSWRAVFQAPGVLNPFRVGFFAVSLVSHKMLRWWSGVFIAVIGIGIAMWTPAVLGRLPAAGWAAAAGLTLAVLLVPLTRRALSLAAYFLVINAASLFGVVKGSVGRVSGTWRPPRQQPHPDGAGQVVALSLGLAVGATLIVATALAGLRAVIEGTFWTSVVLLAYIYVGYPLLIAAAARGFGRPRRKRQIEPRLAFLIVANDEAAVIGAKLSNSLAVDYPRHRMRLMVASDGSVDATNEIVRSYASQGVELLAFPERHGKIAAINAAVAALDDVEIVLFSDANVFLRPWAIRELVANFDDPEVGAVSGDVMLVGDRAALAWSEDLYYRYERWLQKTESALGYMIGVDGALYAMRRSLFVPQAHDTILDDMAIPMAVLHQNYRVVFEPAALAVEQGSQSAWEEFSRKSRVIAGAAQFLLRCAAQIPFHRPLVVFSLFSHKILRWLSPVLAMTALGCSLALAPGSALFQTVSVVHAGVLLLGLAGCIPALRRHWLLGLAHYYCLVQTAAAVGFLRGLRGRQEAAWQRFARTPVETAVAIDPARTAGTS